MLGLKLNYANKKRHRLFILIILYKTSVTYISTESY